MSDHIMNKLASDLDGMATTAVPAVATMDGCSPPIGKEKRQLHTDYKASGNDAYRQEDYQTAISHYTLAIEVVAPQVEASRQQPSHDVSSRTATEALKLSLASYYTNRAAGFFMLSKYDDAIQDCDAALAIDPTWAKAHTRKAKAYTAIGKLDEAIESYSMGVTHGDANEAMRIKEVDNLVNLKQHYKLAEYLVTKLRDSIRDGEDHSP